jgi:hypothetical protein
MALNLNNFGGVSFRLDAEKLQQNMAQRAIDCNFNDGNITGLRGATSHASGLGDPPKGGFIYRTANSFKAYGWTYETDPVRSPVATDIYKRFYWTGKPNATTTEYRFSRSLEAEGYIGSPGASYKVGVINSSVWDDKLSTLGVTFRVAPRRQPAELSAITNSTSELWIADKDGLLVQKIVPANMVWVNLNTKTGIGDALTITLSKTLAAYADVAVAGDATYTKRDDEVTIEGYATSYKAKLWYVGESLRYVELLGATASLPADLTLVNITRSTDGEKLGEFHVRSGTTFSFNGTNLPTTLAADTNVALPADPKLAFVWKFDYNGQRYSGTFHEDKSLSSVMDFANGVTASISRDNTGLIFTLTAQWGSDLPVEVRSYVATFVNQLGEESEPSAPVELTLNPGSEEARIEVNAATWVAKVAELKLDTDRYPLHGCRVYRTASDSTGNADFLYAFTVKIAGDNLPGDVYESIVSSAGGINTFADTTPAAGLGSACPTQNLWRDANDFQLLQGLTAINNNMLAAFYDEYVAICEPGQPWAIRSDAVYTLPSKVVQLVAVEQGFIAFTESSPYYFTGPLPDQMQYQRIQTDMPIINKGAAVSLGGMVYYISTDGPVIINGMTTQPDPNFSREKFRENYRNMMAGGALAEGMKLITFGHRLVCYCPGSVQEAKGWLYDVEDGAWVELSDRIDFAMVIPAKTFGLQHDNVAINNGGDNNWHVLSDDDTPSTWTWHSREFMLPQPINFARGYLRGEGIVTVTVYVDGVQWYSFAKPMTAEGEEFPLKGGRMSEKWSFKFAGYEGTVLKQFKVGFSSEDIRSV